MFTSNKVKNQLAKFKVNFSLITPPSQQQLVDSSYHLLSIPFPDSSGDWLEFQIIENFLEGTVTIGEFSIAGDLFSLEQSEEGSPALELLKRLSKFYNLTMNYSDGQVELTVPVDSLADKLPSLISIAIIMSVMTPLIARGHITINA